MANPAQQAAQAAGAAVPTRGSINRQYGQSIGDTEGFAKALLGMLQQGPRPGAGYDSAVSQQQGITQAAQNQLAGLGSPFSAGSAAAVGGLGRSALSSLVAQGAAAKSYGAKMPGVAAARGQFGVQSLENARQNALTQRGADYRSAYLTALQQARSNAFNQKLAMSQLGLQKQQFKFQKNQAQVANTYRNNALAQNADQFKKSQAQQFEEYLMGLHAKVSSGRAAGMQQFSPGEIAALEKRGSDYAQVAILHGIPMPVAIRNMMAQNIPRSVAMVQAQLEYANATRPTKNEFTKGGGAGQGVFDQNGYKSALRAYQTVMQSLQSWVNLGKWRRIVGPTPGSSGSQPGRGTRGGRGGR